MTIDKQAILEHFAGDFIPFYSKHLAGLKRNGKEFLARCPFHADENPSLSINPVTGLFKCYGCGAGGDVFTFHGKRNGLEGDFPAVLDGIAADFGITGNGSKPHQADGKAGKITNSYDYRDAAGNLLFQVCRMEPKSFRQRRPDGNGGWAWNLGGVERVLYRLPELLKTDEIWLVEGEKDADNLAALGLTATTNAGGAGKWLPAYSDTLAGKRVFIVPDNDDVGRQHAELVARSLHGKAASLRVINLPGLPDKGDVSDFIASMGDPDTVAEALSVMADRAPEWAPAVEAAQEEPRQDQEAAPRFQFVHNAEILSVLRAVEWRIRGILTDSSLYYIFGDPGSFKTFMEIDRLLHISSGIDYHGHPVKQGTVFYIAGEGQQGIGRRIAAWHIAHKTKAADVPFFVSRTPTQLMNLEAIQDVRRAVDAMAKEYGPPAVVHIDTLARNFGEGDENATKDMNAAISNLDRAFGADFCLGITHHTGHGNKDRARGSMALHGAADAAFRVSLTEAGQIVVECKKAKDAPPAPLMVFERREILLQIGDTEDRSFVMDLVAEGDEARAILKPRKAVELKGSMAKAVGILRNLYAQYRENLLKGNRASAKPLVSYLDWRAACMVAGLYRHTDTFRRACDTIVLSGLVEFDETRNFVYLKETIGENGD